MRQEFLPFSKPSVSEGEITAIAEVLRSGWLTTGKKAHDFEEKICQYTGSSGAVALSSATAAMHLLLTTLNIGPGDEVITPSMTWVSTVNMVICRGATPVFVDVEPHSLMTNAALIEPLISKRTKLIIPVHFGGAAVDMAPIRTLAAENNIFLAEDAAHAIGTKYKGNYVGSQGTALFSFHPIKNITTGEGGMFCSDETRLLQSIKRLKFHGLRSDAHDRTQQGRSAQAEVVEPGFKYNMTDIGATLGLGQLDRLDQFISQRTLLANRYLDCLQDVEEILPLEVPASTTRHAWHLFVVRLDDRHTQISRDSFMEELKKRNIGTGLHFRAVHEHHYYRRALPANPKILPATTWNSKRICSLPLFPEMTIDDVDDVISTIKEVLNK